ncbi:olfactory receptor 11L1-like [Hyperolius riggenbachi]|uniref:olfactory receptor 11L1-like n=1 Tax=Hyperolius riggenbachi TaxID=752182 RepID=UPI0035A3050A
MTDTYQNNVTTIFFMGFHMGKFNLLAFVVLLMIYFMTICGNLLIITLVFYNKTLHSPMYFFLTQLSIADIMLTTDISPNMLNIVLHEGTSISFSGCVTQLHFFGLSEISECFLLMVMSYDRYLAICSPLHYTSIMNQGICVKLVCVSWILSCCVELILTLSIYQLQFCGPNTVDHFFCDLNALMNLSCSDVSMVKMEAILVCIPVVVLPFFLIAVSYTYIVLTILKIPSFSGRLKAFSTCSSHLTVVCIFFGTLMAIYMLPNEGQSQMLSRIVSMLYTVITPLLNPFIYSLRNKDIKLALRSTYKSRRY